MPTKFYFRRTASGVSGTLPSTTVELSAVAPTWTPGNTNSVANTPLLTNLTMNDTIGVSTAISVAYSTDNVTTDQKQPIMRFVSDPIGAQTISAQVINLFTVVQQSNSASACSWSVVIVVWRPSSGSAVGTFFDGLNVPLDVGPVGTGQSATTLTTSSGNTTSVTSANNDVLIVEFWRSADVQTMGTSYTNWFYYDGSNEGQASNYANRIEFTNNITMASAGPQDTPELYGRGSLQSERLIHQLLAT